MSLILLHDEQPKIHLQIRVQSINSSVAAGVELTLNSLKGKSKKFISDPETRLSCQQKGT